MLEGNEGAKAEIHESARAHIERGQYTKQQLERWREDLGKAAVGKLLKQYAA